MDVNIMDFDLDAPSDYINEESFIELCSSLTALDMYRESVDLYIEAINDPQVNKQGAINKAMKNTRDIAGKTGDVVGTVVDAKATQYNAAARLVLSIFKHVARIIKFGFGKVTDLINGAAKLSDKIGDIPEALRAKMKGNIRLYITVGDIKLIYNASLIRKIDDFIADFPLLTKGEVWGTTFHPNTVVTDHGVIKSNDLKLCKELHALAVPMKNVSFDLTTINVEDPRNQEAYFSNTKVIDFVDSRGKKHNSSYAEALGLLLKDIDVKKEDINNLQDAFNAKITESEINQTWATLGRNRQKLITDVMNDASIVLSVIGNLFRYITTDMNTIKAAIDKIVKNNYKAAKKAMKNAEKAMA